MVLNTMELNTMFSPGKAIELQYVLMICFIAIPLVLPAIIALVCAVLQIRSPLNNNNKPSIISTTVEEIGLTNLLSPNPTNRL